MSTKQLVGCSSFRDFGKCKYIHIYYYDGCYRIQIKEEKSPNPDIQPEIFEWKFSESYSVIQSRMASKVTQITSFR